MSLQRILLIGDEKRINAFRHCIQDVSSYEIEISDGDEEEDFDTYQMIVDLNFDDNDENFPIYAGLKDQIVLLSAAKQSISEAIYKYDVKVKSKLFGINAIPHYLQFKLWEISAFRFPEYVALESFLKPASVQWFKVSDRVGLLRPRVDFIQYNELCNILQEQLLLDSDIEHALTHPYLQAIENIGITDIFETLLALYDDTKEIKYYPGSFLKTRYLRNQPLIKKSK